MDNDTGLARPRLFYGWWVVDGRVRGHACRLRQRLHFQRFRRIAAAGFRRLARLGVAGVLAGGLSVFWPGNRQRPARRPFRLAPARGRRHDLLTGLGLAAASMARSLIESLCRLRARRWSRCRLRLCAGDRRGAAMVRPPPRLCLRPCGQRHRRRHAGDATAGDLADRKFWLARGLPGARDSRSHCRRRIIAADRKRSARPRSRFRRRPAAAGLRHRAKTEGRSSVRDADPLAPFPSACTPPT